MALRLGWFSTARGEGSRRLFEGVAQAIQRGYIDADIEFVFCNRQPGEYEATDEFFKLVESYNVPVISLSSRFFRKAARGKRSQPSSPLPTWRHYYDEHVVRCIDRGAQLALPGMSVARKHDHSPSLILTKPVTGRRVEPEQVETDDSSDLSMLGSEDLGRALHKGLQPTLEGFSSSDSTHPESLPSMANRPFDLGILAGYMLIATEYLCEHCDLLNLHPALPEGPSGTWQDVIWQLIEARATQAGAMMHLVTKNVDRGPPVTYCTFSLRGGSFDPLWNQLETRALADAKTEGEDNALFKEIRRHGLAREFPLVIETIRAFAEGRLRMTHRKVVDPSGESVSPLDLTQEIQKVVASTLNRISPQDAGL